MDFLFPKCCAYCASEGDFLCLSCVRRLKIKRIKPFLGFKKNEFNYLDGLIYAMDYSENPAIKIAIKQFKYKYTQELADYFGGFILKKIRELNMTRGLKVVLIPIPLHKKRLAERGFNQSELLARSVAQNEAEIKVESFLFRFCETSQQARLTREERFSNLEGVFKLSKNLNGVYQKNTVYFLLDDVATTGATLESAAKTLKSAGFKKVYGLVLARAFK